MTIEYLYQLMRDAKLGFYNKETNEPQAINKVLKWLEQC